MKRILIVLLIVAVAISSVFAANARKGKKIWKKSCRLVCHDGSKPGAPALSPVEMTQAQWKELFSSNRDGIRAVHVKGEFNKIRVDEKDWADMYLYLYDHALDSDQPETCG